MVTFKIDNDFDEFLSFYILLPLYIYKFNLNRVEKLINLSLLIFSAS